MKLTKMIYIASSYSCNHPDLKIKMGVEYERAMAVTRCIGALHDKYPYAFLGPITQSHQTAPHTKTKSGGFEHWKTIDFTYLSRCDEIWVLADVDGAWQRSVGVTAELEFASANDIPIRFIHPDTYEVKKMRMSNKRAKAC